MNPAFQRLIDLVKLGLGLKEGVPPLQPNEKHIWKLACRHQLNNLLAPSILDTNSIPEMTDEVRYCWQLAGLREEFYSRTLEELLASAKSNGISAFGLKGIDLARKVYPKRGFRLFRDLDVLVKPDDLGKMHELLQSKEYDETRPQGPLKNATRLAGSTIVACERGIDAISYAKGDVNLEIHTRFLPPSLGVYPMEGIWNSPEMPAEDFWIHLAFHATRHHFLCGLRHLVDLALWAGRVRSFDVVHNRLENSQLFNLAWPAWRLASEIFPEQISTPPKLRGILVRHYTDLVRAQLPAMPDTSIGLAGSPLPFLLMGGNLWTTARGTRDLAQYQMGRTNFFSYALWFFKRPFGLLRRHGPVMWNWFKFSIRTFRTS